ncbi:hypothetical protein K488DRAFT_90828 [Vararia minispora EC-137]|uniref:Uncharacterized protein n=1 Tax=Vararia minispora EC-137 TaxID=1314806 RepID=A0ACB8Q745_9AGAM|nr:hypothetical protein K488DRAFT_90828 [Vararia minispora EC-137]
MYLGDNLGDLVVITLNNAVEATLAIILLLKCELKLLQSTIVGVVLLHLLLIPGTGFLIGGARVLHQHLDPHQSQLNHSLLIIGVMALVVPSAFFTSLNRSGPLSAEVLNTDPITDGFRHDFLRMARGAAVVLLLVYFASRIYLHNPPGEGNAFRPTPDAPHAAIKKDKELEEVRPVINPLACIILLCVSVALMAVTAEFLVESIDFVRQSSNIQEEWFGLFLLPIVSFSADGTLAVVFFIRSLLKGWFGEPLPPDTLAEDKAIDLSIQFTLFWMPFLVLLGWWTDRPLSTLFDLYEVTVLVASCFLVNYVTADAKTNWVEGMVMIAFYVIIALSSWFYTGQPEIRIMSACETIAAALVTGVASEG